MPSFTDRLAVSILPAMFALATPAFAQETSVITVPIEASLAELQSFANSKLPNQIHLRNSTQVCIPAERACTKIPEFRGFKIYSRMECVDVSPRIKCDLTENITRSGSLRVSGNGNTLTLKQNLDGSVRARGRGAIGKNITQSVRARAEFTITASPYLESDWSLIPNISLTHRWIDRPSFKLFNLINVSIGSKVDPKLREALNKVQTETIPTELRKLDIRGKVRKLWAEIQEPISLDAGDDNLWLHIRPSAVGMQRPSFENAKMRAALSISAHLKVLDTKTSGTRKTTLPNLGIVPPGDSRLSVPVSFRYSFLNTLLARELPKSFDFEGPAPGSVLVSKVVLGHRENGLKIKASVKAKTKSSSLRLLGLDEYSGTLEMIAKPHFNSETDTLELHLLRLAPEASDAASKILSWAITSGPLGEWMRKQLSIEMKRELDKVRRDLNKVLNNEIADGLRLQGAATLRIKDLNASRAGISATLYSTGKLRLIGFNPLTQR